MNEKEYMKRTMKCFLENGFTNPIALIASGIEIVIHDGYSRGKTPEAVVEAYKQEHGIS